MTTVLAAIVAMAIAFATRLNAVAQKAPTAFAAFALALAGASAAQANTYKLEATWGPNAEVTATVWFDAVASDGTVLPTDTVIVADGVTYDPETSFVS